MSADDPKRTSKCAKIDPAGTLVAIP